MYTFVHAPREYSRCLNALICTMLVSDEHRLNILHFIRANRLFIECVLASVQSIDIHRLDLVQSIKIWMNVRLQFTCTWCMWLRTSAANEQHATCFSMRCISSNFTSPGHVSSSRFSIQRITDTIKYRLFFTMPESELRSLYDPLVTDGSLLHGQPNSHTTPHWCSDGKQTI